MTFTAFYDWLDRRRDTRWTSIYPWLNTHGLIARGEDGSAHFRTYTWNWRFWRGPYWRCGPSATRVTLGYVVFRPTFRQSWRATCDLAHNLWHDDRRCTEWLS